METAILAVAILGFSVAGYGAWRLRDLPRTIRNTRTNLDALHSMVMACLDDTGTIRDVLTKASQIKAQRAEPVFDRDTIQPTGPRRYTPIALRRAQAEAQSMGPQNHDERVRHNNARAIESAG